MGLAQRLLAIKQQATGPKSLYQIISDLGLTSNLKLCLDAGDSASYNPSVQTDKWLDTSGNGTDFFRGSGAGTDAADPAFNGTTGGLSSSEYFSSDGGDYFLYDSTNEAWMQNLHKDSAVFSLFSVQYVTSTSSNHYTFTTRTSSGTTGTAISIVRGSTASPFLFVGNSTGSVLQANSNFDAVGNRWNAFGISVNEASGSGTFLLNGNSESFTSTYGLSATGNSASTAAIGAAGAGASPNPASSRVAVIAIWEGVALTSSQLTSIYDEIKGRFGL